jgi:hypothetical protein
MTNGFIKQTGINLLVKRYKEFIRSVVLSDTKTGTDVRFIQIT